MRQIVPLMQTPDACGRRAQFQLWIFSYTVLTRPSKKRLSRVFIQSMHRRAEAAPFFKRPSRPRQRPHLAPQAALLAPAHITPGDALGGALDGRAEAEQREHGREQPACEVESREGE